MTPFSINIVSIGRWNKRLFTPNWVSKNLFGLSPGTRFAGYINPEELDFVFAHDDLQLIPRDDLVEIRIVQNIDKEETISTANKIFTRLITTLPHTPIKGTGFNVRYQITENDHSVLIDKIRKRMEPIDDLTLGGLLFNLRIGDYQRNLIIDKINLGKKYFEMNFNYHYDVQTKISSSSFIENYKDSLREINT